MKKTFAIIIIIPVLLFGIVFGLDGASRANAQKEHVWLMETLLPGGKDFVKVAYEEEDTLIKSVHKCDKGFVIETVTNGYADELCAVVGVSNDGKVMGLVVLEAHETFGLGSKILTDHVFLSHFLNKSGTFTIGTSGDDAFSGATSETESTGDEIYIDGISGATVSSKAVAKCVSAAVAYVTGADVGSSATEWGG